MRNCNTCSIKLFYQWLEWRGCLLVCGFFAAFVRVTTSEPWFQRVQAVNLRQIIYFSILKYWLPSLYKRKKNICGFCFTLFLYEYMNFSKYIFSDTNFKIYSTSTYYWWQLKLRFPQDYRSINTKFLAVKQRDKLKKSALWC